LARRRLSRWQGCLPRSGLYRIAAPADCGGEGVAPAEQIETIETISRFDASAGWNLMIGVESFGLIAPAMARCRDLIADPEVVHYLAQTVYEGHVTDVPDPPGRADNLFTPVQGDFAAHGPYDAEATDVSSQFWLNKHRNALAMLGVATVAACGAAWLTHRSSDSAGSA
jgi:hypothetical protein